MRAAFESEFRKTNGPDVTHFAQFQKAWGTSDQKKYEPGITKSQRYKAADEEDIRDVVHFELSNFVTGHTIDFFNRFKFSTKFLRSDLTKWKNII